ncbi:probable E3 ubiquitin-protein ligase DTX3 [Actinia tenebrosa]|uniref:E3 ubiquitin-protein ligase n=1 Tax=Actinia tenebrosa TaxID=6105 RepID=A0A6P8IF89_ACTTE|nr:probable E3 ubiquitin-protein ligase DTX3 [Actinia tenebrosa]
MDSNYERIEKGTTSAISNKNQECGFCFSTRDAAQFLRICDSGHAVCRNCFDNLQNADRNSVCPTCHEVVPRIALQPPNGQMKSGIIEKGLVGHESCATIYVDYEFPEGTQGLFHPNPGTPYDKLSRRTFLPDNEEGREVLDLLKNAFDASILFTVGKSTINDKDNQIIFNEDIEHKTNVNGGPKVSATLKLPWTYPKVSLDLICPPPAWLRPYCAVHYQQEKKQVQVSKRLQNWERLHIKQLM